MSSTNNNTNNNNDNNGNAPRITTTRTVLRIKRRRNEDPLPYLRLEGLDGSMKRQRSSAAANDDGDDDEDQKLSELMQNSARLHPPNTHTNNTKTNSTTTAAPFKPTKSNTSAIWKRMRPDDNNESSRETYRVVDAVLEEDATPTSKRRKLTVLETSSQTKLLPAAHKTVKKKKGLKVLDPLSRLVDDSLQEVIQGMKSARQHYTFIKTDVRLAHEFIPKWLSWCHSAGGNLLHACAMWNEVELTSEMLQLNSGLQLAEALDGDSKTPYELAELSGHTSICEVLEAFGGDTTNYVYDIFYLEEAAIAENATDAANEDKTLYQENPITTAELTSGVGYWTPFGELVLEAPEKHQASLDHVFDEDGEIDSNCEEYGGNDYPDDDPDEAANKDDHDSDADDDSWAEAFTPDQGFRNYGVEENYYAHEAEAHGYDDT
ncbi:unnamed protein product [Cylindrotheca closterium]|uniref:Probable RNA polymerase II nuclear localization protein SLC7A6OS n=1 Tax=Cylindrotheca closterium TaxID=2856 RepID=A0AAD2CSD3_9STRA|nr:unnamed protein product [Cylindrotheca closterium]